MLPSEGFYLRAFWDLSTERSYGQVLGWIPWSRAIEYASKAGLESDMLRPFWTIIHTMDGGFMDWQSGEYRRASRQQAGGANTPSPQAPRRVRRSLGGKSK